MIPLLTLALGALVAWLKFGKAYRYCAAVGDSGGAGNAIVAMAAWFLPFAIIAGALALTL